MSGNQKTDWERLRPRNRQVLELLLDGEWTNLEQVAIRLGLRNASTVGSRLRDIKAETEYTYEMRRTEIPGLNEYRLFLKPNPNPLQLELSEAVNA